MAFLEGLRVATEAAWRDHVPRDFQATRVGGLDWRPGTRWRGGMADAEIAAAEDQFGLSFPPDYRLFLATLHTPDPPMVGAFYQGSTLVPSEGRRFPDWTGNPEPIRKSLAWPLVGLAWSIEHGWPWPSAWGARPRTGIEREARIRDLIIVGPQMVPVFGHRYLAGPPDRDGNPVLSIYGSDVIVYAPNLASYLAMELDVLEDLPAITLPETVEPISFWQDLIE